MNAPSLNFSVYNPARNPSETWYQARANADNITECQELIAEIEEHTEERLRQKSPFPLLARATRRWLEKALRGNRRATVSVLKTMYVALPTGNETFQWLPILDKGEADVRIHSAISRWLNEGASCPFSSDTVRRLAWAAIQAEYWLPASGHQRGISFRHEYSRQLERQMDCSATTRGNLYRQAPGAFQIYRPSIIFPGRFLVGLFGVALVADQPCDAMPANGCSETPARLDVLRTVEVHRVAPDDIDSTGLAHDLIQAPGAEDVYTGYLVKKSSNIIVHAFNAITSSFQYTIFSDYLLSEPLYDEKNIGIPTRERASLQMASGISVGDGFFCVPTVILRINNIDLAGVGDDDEIIARLRASRLGEVAGIFTADSIPDFVLRQFQIVQRQIDLRKN